MSAILSADDLNDFISPGVACIKPVETLPKNAPKDTANEYEVTTEDKVAAANAPPASISLTDCLACSGCVTSAEAVLVSLQSHAEVLNTLDAWPELPLPWNSKSSEDETLGGEIQDGKIFVATVSPQTRASIAATYNVSDKEAGNIISQLLSGPLGLRSTGNHNSAFTWVLDTNAFREIALVAAAQEVTASLSPSAQAAPGGIAREDTPKKPILASACPGWICYAEKTHPHVLPHISRLKSPQALAGTLIKSILARRYGVDPSKIWHLAIMPCFDKKLEASREELTDIHWTPTASSGSREETRTTGIRDVDCVITARELLMLAESRNISFPSLPRTRLPRSHRPRFPDPQIHNFLFPTTTPIKKQDIAAGTSGGYLWHILQSNLHTLRSTTSPNAQLITKRGRNPDVIDYEIIDPTSNSDVLFRAARYYGFRNIQNLVRRLKPARVSRLPGAAARGVGARKPGGAAVSAAAANMTDYAFVEVMACPGGCTNGGGQIKVGDVGELRMQGLQVEGSASASGIENGSAEQVVLPQQKEWLSKVDEAYFSAEDNASPLPSEDDEDEDGDEQMRDAYTNEMATKEAKEEVIDAISHTAINALIAHWSAITGVERDVLIKTSYRKVESDVGKKSASDVERVAGLASTIGGGW